MLERTPLTGLELETPFDAILAGDEGDDEPRRSADLGRALLETAIRDVKPSVAITLPVDAPVEKALEAMRRRKVSAVMVVAADRPHRLAGIFTERDVMNRVVPLKGLSLRMDEVMTPAPESLHPGDSLSYALNRMCEGHLRHVPIVDEEGVPVGMISVRDVLDFLVELVPEAVLNLPSDPKLAIHPKVDGE
jgi:CBS domain-containing protein